MVLQHLTRRHASGQHLLPACAAVLKEFLCLDIRPQCMPAQKAAWDVDLMSGVIISQLQVQASAFTSVSVHKSFSRFHVVRLDSQHACLPLGDTGGNPCCRGSCAATAATLCCLLRRLAGPCRSAWRTPSTRAPARCASSRLRKRGSRRRCCRPRCRARQPSHSRTFLPHRRAAHRLWHSWRPSRRCASQPALF